MGVFSWLSQAGTKDTAAPRSERAKPVQTYRAAEVVPCSAGSCHAARSVEGKRFLEREVPMLPLRDCDRPDCECTYRRHPDRRAVHRRAADLGGDLSSTTLRQRADRRSHDARGRRATDPRPTEA